MRRRGGFQSGLFRQAINDVFFGSSSHRFGSGCTNLLCKDRGAWPSPSASLLSIGRRRMTREKIHQAAFEISDAQTEIFARNIEEIDASEAISVASSDEARESDFFPFFFSRTKEARFSAKREKFSEPCDRKIYACPFMTYKLVPFYAETHSTRRQKQRRL